MNYAKGKPCAKQSPSRCLYKEGDATGKHILASPCSNETLYKYDSSPARMKDRHQRPTLSHAARKESKPLS